MDASRLNPYARSLRPALPASLPQYIDAELQKIAVATQNIVQAIQDLDARTKALEGSNI